MAKKIKKMKKLKNRKYIKDKGIVNFLLQHLKPQNINFSKIKIPSFFESCNDSDGKNTISSNDIKEPSHDQTAKKLPSFGLTLLAELENDENLFEGVKFVSSIFK